MKKSGFTLIEMIIVMALTVVVLGIVYSIFNTGNKVFSDADVKSTLQMEARDIQEELTSIGMQGIGVTAIEVNDHDRDGVSLYVDKKHSELTPTDVINRINIKGYDKDNEYPINGSGTISNPKYYDIQVSSENFSINSKPLSNHVKSFDVVPQDINDSFANASSIKFNIVLHQKKGPNDILYPINFTVTFRNKGN